MDIVEHINQRQFKQKHVRLLQMVSRLMWLEKLDFHTLGLAGWKQPNLPKMRLKAEFGLGGEADVMDLVRDAKLDGKSCEEYYLRKIRDGQKLLMARLGEDIIFYLWVVPGVKDMMDKFLRLEHGEVAIERGFTRREFRGHGLFAYGLAFLFPLLRDEGVTSCLTEIAPYNMPMIHTAAKLGFRKTDSCYYWFRHPFGHHVFPRGPLAGRFVKKSHWTAGVTSQEERKGNNVEH